MTITLIYKNRKPIAFAANETEAKQMIMNKLEKFPNEYENVNDWWERTGWNVKQVYDFKEIENRL